MQTFLPFSDFERSAASLDYKRLGKQRVETLQIINALMGKTKGWVNHPATRMWSGHEHLLAVYGKAMCIEWRRRGYKDSLLPRFEEFCEMFPASTGAPAWLGDERLHVSHQSNLVRKMPEFYSNVFPNVTADLPYFWPENKGVQNE